MTAIPPVQTRFSSVDAAKGVAILLVLFGHYVPETAPQYWKNFAGPFLYGFHMDIFFIISGYLFACKSQPMTVSALWNFIIKKAKRLMIPFFSIALLYFLIKYPLQYIFSMHKPITGDSLFLVIANPAQSYVGLIWFLETLFFIFIIYGVFSLVIKNKYIACVALSFISIIMHPEYPILQLICKYLPAFCIGTLLPDFLDKVYQVAHPIATGILFLCLAIAIFSAPSGIFWGYAHVLKALILFLLFLSIAPCFPQKLFTFFTMLGLYGSSIYLFHFPFEAAIKKLVDQVLHVTEPSFWIFAITAFCLGIFCSIFIEQYIFSHSPRLLPWLIGEKPVDKRTGRNLIP